MLPNALKNANVKAWLVICRENNNDPIADHIGGKNAGGTAAFLFYNDDKGFLGQYVDKLVASTELVYEWLSINFHSK